MIAAGYTPDVYTGNGSTTVFAYNFKIVDDDQPATSSGYAAQNLSTLWFPAATDYFTLRVKQDTGGNLNITPDGYAGVIFWAYFVGSGAG